MDMLKNAKKLQEQMGDFQKKMEGVVVTGSSGGGMAEVDMNGRMDVVAIRITPEIVNPQEIDMLQDLILFAFSDALEKVRGAVSAQMGQLVSGIGGDVAGQWAGGGAP
jgi:DNA-binding YbaB/EbfC family protein